MERVFRHLMIGILSLCVCATWASDGMADVNNPQHLQNKGQQKVSSVKAKRWLQDGESKDGYQQQQDQTIVNFGSKKAGNCTMNVGTSASGPGAPKDIVVVGKEFINICK